jgi:hypothetical protein
VLLVFNAVDLLILDWLVFATLRPRIVVLPGTEGAQGYGDYGFHFRAFLKGLGGRSSGASWSRGKTCRAGASWPLRGGPFRGLFTLVRGRGLLIEVH